MWRTFFALTWRVTEELASTSRFSTAGPAARRNPLNWGADCADARAAIAVLAIPTADMIVFFGALCCGVVGGGGRDHVTRASMQGTLVVSLLKQRSTTCVCGVSKTCLCNGLGDLRARRTQRPKLTIAEKKKCEEEKGSQRDVFEKIESPILFLS